ncbi:MAG: XRE family transcriptional regulator [Gemmatimonadetes bacterium]|nr:XRE family transcriptional regulator [Gemmatimonadota bacterium]
MKITRVRANNRRRVFEVCTGRRILHFPYALAEPAPTPDNRIVELYVDPELGREGFTYMLQDGTEGSVHIDDVLDYNGDPAYLRDLLLYRLTLEAQKRIERCGLSRREVIRRLQTSPSQLYRLLDQTNYRKSVDRMLELLGVLGCEIELTVGEARTRPRRRERTSARRAS